jgi:hypothetical protein
MLQNPLHVAHTWALSGPAQSNEGSNLNLSASSLDCRETVRLLPPNAGVDVSGKKMRFLRRIPIDPMTARNGAFAPCRMIPPQTPGADKTLSMCSPKRRARGRMVQSTKIVNHQFQPGRPDDPTPRRNGRRHRPWRRTLNAQLTPRHTLRASSRSIYPRQRPASAVPLARPAQRWRSASRGVRHPRRVSAEHHRSPHCAESSLGRSSDRPERGATCCRTHYILFKARVSSQGPTLPRVRN